MNNLHYQAGVCEVHKYALNDTTLRQVFYCNVCQAWICNECNYNAARRAKAALVRKARRFFGNDY